MISLLYLKHAFNESDEGEVERWRNAGAIGHAGSISRTAPMTRIGFPATPPRWSSSASAGHDPDARQCGRARDRVCGAGLPGGGCTATRRCASCTGVSPSA
jgi:hypothetical protein